MNELFNRPSWNVIGWESGSVVESARVGPELTSSIKTKLKTTYLLTFKLRNKSSIPQVCLLGKWLKAESEGTWGRNPGRHPHRPAGVIPVPASFQQTQQQSLRVWETWKGCLAVLGTRQSNTMSLYTNSWLCMGCQGKAGGWSPDLHAGDTAGRSTWPLLFLLHSR